MDAKNVMTLGIAVCLHTDTTILQHTFYCIQMVSHGLMLGASFGKILSN
ncbi:hypothetical protein C427_0845 [Paraglaciecola psychrophila 170]|jgi:hypothetical protein|uniref:Uncharacterized protein n=1 Tax=Paraglaciecola psychrophila 170 TaxID=1129794 RepID=K6ZST0_9ALTE|nr:hypothetical protein C427_0845 [Paraglaciecola psychrophila 170]GAC38991.1 hypothetical protein GPSY_3380 [Paraglaciecola psychrophila 170]